MGQFSMIPEREKILAKIPDYAVDIVPAGKRIRVEHDGTTIADSKGALLVRETRHADVYYLPREDVNMSLLSPTDHETYCPFKGYANYWSLQVDGTSADNIVWSYESPYDEVIGLKGYMSFYADRVQISAE